jgi:hypothetical protein
VHIVQIEPDVGDHRDRERCEHNGTTARERGPLRQPRMRGKPQPEPEQQEQRREPGAEQEAVAQIGIEDAGRGRGPERGPGHHQQKHQRCQHPACSAITGG